MIARVYRFLGVGALVMYGVVAGVVWMVKPAPAVPVPVPNNEQLVKATSALIDWLERSDTEALGYDFPTLLGCHPPQRRWIRDGLACDFGVTYLDESTRRYTISLDRHNIPLYVTRSRRTEPLPSIP